MSQRQQKKDHTFVWCCLGTVLKGRATSSPVARFNPAVKDISRLKQISLMYERERTFSAEEIIWWEAWWNWGLQPRGEQRQHNYHAGDESCTDDSKTLTLDKCFIVPSFLQLIYFSLRIQLFRYTVVWKYYCYLSYLFTVFLHYRCLIIPSFGKINRQENIVHLSLERVYVQLC